MIVNLNRLCMDIRDASAVVFKYMSKLYNYSRLNSNYLVINNLVIIIIGSLYNCPCVAQLAKASYVNLSKHYTTIDYINMDILVVHVYIYTSICVIKTI